MGQFKNRYPNDAWQEIIGNCDIRTLLGASDYFTAEYFSDLLGVATAENVSIRKEAGFEGELNYGQKNISNVQRKLLTPDEILRLPTDKILVIIRGNKPILLDKQIYTKHPLYKSLKDTPINEYVPEWKKIKEIVKNELKAENTKLSFKTF